MVELINASKIPRKYFDPFKKRGRSFKIELYTSTKAHYRNRFKVSCCMLLILLSVDDIVALPVILHINWTDRVKYLNSPRKFIAFKRIQKRAFVSISACRLGKDQCSKEKFPSRGVTWPESSSCIHILYNKKSIPKSAHFEEITWVMMLLQLFCLVLRGNINGCFTGDGESLKRPGEFHIPWLHFHTSQPILSTFLMIKWVPSDFTTSSHASTSKQGLTGCSKLDGE